MDIERRAVIAMIDGMPTIWGNGAVALIERSGLLDDMHEKYQSNRRLRSKLPQLMRLIDIEFGHAPGPSPMSQSLRDHGNTRMKIELVAVMSSQIAAVGYDPAKSELVAQFRSHRQGPGPIYCYAGVPPEVASGIFRAASPGSYFHQQIRNGPYAYRRHEETGSAASGSRVHR